MLSDLFIALVVLMALLVILGSCTFAQKNLSWRIAVALVGWLLYVGILGIVGVTVISPCGRLAWRSC